MYKDYVREQKCFKCNKEQLDENKIVEIVRKRCKKLAYFKNHVNKQIKKIVSKVTKRSLGTKMVDKINKKQSKNNDASFKKRETCMIKPSGSKKCACLSKLLGTCLLYTSPSPRD